MTQSRSVRRFARLFPEALEDRCTPALFGAIDNSVTLASNAGGPTNVGGVAIGDFDGDGRPDLAVCDINSNEVSILLGSGDGGFRSTATIPVGISPVDVVTADFNGDGRLDLAVANINLISNDVSILLGDGTGQFNSPPSGTIPVGLNPRCIVVADFNGDGRRDIAVANSGGNTVSVALGSGDGTFGMPLGFMCGALPNGVVAGDFNGDGFEDLATCNQGSTDVTVLLGDGAGIFSQPIFSPAGSTPLSLATADFDRDGRLDLVVANINGPGVSMLLGEGTGSFVFSNTFDMGTFPFHVAVGDVNRDGLMDVVVADNNGKMSVALGDGNGRINRAPGSPFAAGTSPFEVAIGDLNGDGNSDIVCSNYNSSNVTIHLNRGATVTEVSSSAIQAVFGQTITFRATVTTLDGLSPSGIVTFRMGDTVIGTDQVVNGSASIVFGPNTPFPVGSHSITARYTGDSHICTSARAIQQIVTKASTSITAIAPTFAPAAGQRVVLKAVVNAVDLLRLGGQVVFRDGDTVIGTAQPIDGIATLPWTFTKTGRHDYIVQYRESDFYFGSISPATPIAVVGTAHKIVTGVGAGGGPLVKVFGTDGSLERSFFAYSPTFKGGVRVAKGDVTGDGIDDIITAPGSGAMPHVRVFNGSTGIEVRSFFAYSPTFRGGVNVAAGDVNGDGRADIVTAPGATSNFVRVFSGMTGAELFNLQAYPSTFRGGVRVAVGDVNGDQGADIIVAPGKGPAQSVRVFSGKDPAHPELFSFLPFDKKFTGGVNVSAGDVNGDGKADIIVAPGSGMLPMVRVVDGDTHVDVYPAFAPFDTSLKSGVTVATGDWDGDGKADIVVAAGAGGGPHVRVFSGLDPSLELQSFFAFDPAFTGGGFVG